MYIYECEYFLWALNCTALCQLNSITGSRVAKDHLHECTVAQIQQFHNNKVLRSVHRAKQIRWKLEQTKQERSVQAKLGVNSTTVDIRSKWVSSKSS